MWDAQQYLRFGGERARPFFDLIARIGAAEPGYVADLGCGPGNLTQVLARRWPGYRDDREWLRRNGATLVL